MIQDLLGKEKGEIITIEGNDGSGKETQTRLLINKLREEGYPCETMSFPRYGTPTGRIIGQAYLGKEGLGEGDIAWFGDPTIVDPKIVSPYYAVDRLAALPEIKKIISSGKHLIFDRWVETNMVHQASKEKDSEKRIDIMKFIHDFEYGLLQLPKPDGTIFLHMPYEVSAGFTKERGKLDGHESNLEYLKDTEQVFLGSSKIYGWSEVDCAPDGTMNSLRSIEDIAEEVYGHAMEILNS